MSTPLPIIIETDLGNDIDDALAIGLAHALSRRGLCDILAVTINKDNYYGAVFADILNTFYGRSDIPIGLVRGGFTSYDGYFIRQLSTEVADGVYKYPRKGGSLADYPEAVSVLRKALDAAEDRSVVIVSIGLLTNLARLLTSAADRHSDLSGMELVRKKVKSLSIMAGDFRPEALAGLEAEHREWNIFQDIESSRYVLAHWPGEMIFSGKEIGEQILFPAEVVENGFSKGRPHPVVEGYKLFKPMPYHRPCYDLTSVLEAVFPGRFFETSPHGIIAVEGSEALSFTPDPDGRHRYLILDRSRIDEIRDYMVELCTKFPAGEVQQSDPVFSIKTMGL